MIDADAELIHRRVFEADRQQVLNRSRPIGPRHMVEQRERHRIESAGRDLVAGESRAGTIRLTRQRIAERRQRGEVAAPQAVGRHREGLGQRSVDALPFVAEEKERAIAIDRPANVHAELVLLSGGTGCVGSSK